MTARDIANSLENATRPVDRRWMIVGAAAAIALFVFCLAVFNRADPQVNPKLSGNQKEQPREAGLAGEIKVTAWVGERYVAMPEPAPLRNGSKLRIECEVPANMHAAIVNIASDGAINVLTAVTPAAEPQSLGYPEKHGTAAKLGGNEGTEIFLLLVRPDRPIDAEELQAAFDKSKPWPILPDVSVLELRGKKVKLLQKSRDLTPADQEDPEGDASRKLEVLGKDLMQRYAEVHAIAFKHKR